MPGIREMGLEEAYEGWTESRLAQDEAARLFGVYGRTFRCHTHSYEDNGLDGLLDKRLTQVSLRLAACMVCVCC